jgi:hypothetical protein
MTRARIATTQAKFALEKLHAELGGKIKENKREAKRLAQCMKHVEAVLKMLEPGYNVRPISIRRRKLNPWFKQRYSGMPSTCSGSPQGLLRHGR